MNNSIYYIRSTSIINDSRASKEITSLINNNYNVVVIGWDRDKKIKDYNNVVINNNKIENKFFKFNAGYGESKKNILGLLLFQIWLFFILLINHRKYTYIHACDFDCGFVSMIISKLFKKKLVYDMYDYYSDSRTMPKKIERIINNLENKVINHADVSIICGDWRKEQIKYANPKKIVVIHNTPDIRNIGNKKVIKSSSKKIKIGYVGILQDHRLLIEILEKVKNNEKYEFHIGGFGKHENYIKELAEKNKSIFFYGSLAYNDVLCLEQECDILFATYDPKIRNHKYSAPNKIYEAMALGKPIIVCKNTGIDKLVLDERIGVSVDYDADNFIETLNYLIKNKDSVEIMGLKAKKLYNKKYNWISMEKKLIEIYKCLGAIK